MESRDGHMGPMEEATIQELSIMFPNLTGDLVKQSVLHPSNRQPPLDPGHLLQRCIDDLLDLRTFQLSTQADVAAALDEPWDYESDNIPVSSDNSSLDYSRIVQPTRCGSQKQTGSSPKARITHSGPTVTPPIPSVHLKKKKSSPGIKTSHYEQGNIKSSTSPSSQKITIKSPGVKFEHPASYGTTGASKLTDPRMKTPVYNTLAAEDKADVDSDDDDLPTITPVVRNKAPLSTSLTDPKKMERPAITCQCGKCVPQSHKMSPPSLYSQKPSCGYNDTGWDVVQRKVKNDTSPLVTNQSCLSVKPPTQTPQAHGTSNSPTSHTTSNSSSPMYLKHTTKPPSSEGILAFPSAITSSPFRASSVTKSPVLTGQSLTTLITSTSMQHSPATSITNVSFNSAVHLPTPVSAHKQLSSILLPAPLQQTSALIRPQLKAVLTGSPAVGSPIIVSSVGHTPISRTAVGYSTTSRPPHVSTVPAGGGVVTNITFRPPYTTVPRPPAHQAELNKKTTNPNSLIWSAGGQHVSQGANIVTLASHTGVSKSSTVPPFRSSLGSPSITQWPSGGVRLSGGKNHNQQAPKIRPAYPVQHASYRHISGAVIPSTPIQITPATPPVVWDISNHDQSDSVNVVEQRLQGSSYLDAIVISPPGTSVGSRDIDGVEEKVLNVLELFPDACPQMLRRLLLEKYSEDAVAHVCNYLIEHPSYTKKVTPKPPPKKVDSPTRKVPDTEESPTRNKWLTSEECAEFVSCLCYEFRQMGKADLAKVALFCDYNFSKIHKILTEALVSAGATVDRWKKQKKPGTELPPQCISVPVSHSGAEKVFNFKLMKNLRGKRFIEPKSLQLREEMDAIAKQSKQGILVKQDEALAVRLHHTESADAIIECGCCYGDFMFEEMVQCYEGHLFCEECLRRYAKETVFGQGKIKLDCLADGCEYSFPKSQLEKALSLEVRQKYEERQQEESLNLAGLDDLVRCKYCDFAAVMDECDKVFRCQNQGCMKETCRHCGEDWVDHFGLRCSELEKKDETSLRTSFEEKMTEAKIRKCWQCKTSFTKLDGCNKITCRCGAKMCYICRKPKIDYKHFCQHPRQPGKLCDSCTACSLWSSPEEDDERAVREIRKQAQAERVKEGYTDDKLIGAPEDNTPPFKKRKR